MGIGEKERDYAINPNERRLIEREREENISRRFLQTITNEETTLLSLLFNFSKV